MPPTRRTRNKERSRASASIGDAPLPADLELNSLYVKDLRAICSRLNLSASGTRGALVKRLQRARTTTNSAPGSLSNGQDGDQHVDSALEQQFHNLQHQVQELLNRDNDERLLSPGQLSQVQSVVQGSLNEAIEKAASAAAQAAISAYTGTTVNNTPPVTADNGNSLPLVQNTPGTNPQTVPALPNPGQLSAGTNTQTAPALPNPGQLSAGTNTQTVPALPNPGQLSPATASVHELPTKLVKDILSGEFMELSRLLPKNFNSLTALHEEPLTLTLDKSVIKVTKPKGSSLTDIGEWTTAFTAYMGVLITKYPSRAAELLEYMSLIRYAAKYHRGLGWCVYDIKFRQKAAVNKSLLWSVIDSQLWLKTFTVPPSLMKDEIGVNVFQSGPSSATGTSRGHDNRTCHNFNKGIPCSRTPCRFAHKCNKYGCGEDHPGSKCPKYPEAGREALPSANKPAPHHSGRHRER